MSAEGGTAGSCLLNLLEVSDDLGGTLLNRLAVGAHHKTTHVHKVDSEDSEAAQA